MSKILIFGAGGRAGRAAVREARRRGHDVTAAVRNPADHTELEGAGVDVVAADVTDPGAVARLAPGHDAAIATVFDPTADPGVFYPAASRALLDGLAGVKRLIVVSVAATLEAASGGLLMDTPGYPQEYRGFLLGHAAGIDVLKAADGFDWLVMNPTGDFDHGGGRTGRYTVGPGDAAGRITYDDFAIAVLDEIDTPRHHHTQIGVETR
ncbi:NAD(P)-dependent oxidoreductase [Sinosporangium siamense]|uniref:NAD(P)-binding domain-containing protein n=1 Tax=Sinosporangium siamense TaxID=1367973 RepID=A0A919RIN2_9ACTN|nr:NAD(P)H-binding protein [Sinosporangium siamense]GII94343.1 hypothetical protein Ssi02_45740 [Sinosporangium siamense]